MKTLDCYDKQVFSLEVFLECYYIIDIILIRKIIDNGDIVKKTGYVIMSGEKS